MQRGYSVTVYKDGEPLVTIEREMLSGQDPISAQDAEAIRDAGEHLIAFAGPEHSECFACGGVDACKEVCPITPPSPLAPPSPSD